MALQIGQTVNVNNKVASGVAPGQSQYQTAIGATRIKGIKNVGGQTYYDIDQTGIGGGTGFVLASALEGALGNPAPQGGGGSTGGGIGYQAPPTIDVNAIYQQAYNEAGIAALESSLSAKQKEIDDRRRAFSEAEANVNENPLYAEATRVGRIRRLEEQAQRDINNYISEAQGIQNNIAMKKADVETKLNIALKQYDITRQSVADSVNQFNSLLQLGALNNASGADIAQIARSTGLTTSMIEGAISKAKQSDIKPQVIQSTDAAGNVTVSIIDGQTGNLINQRSLGKIASGSSGTGSGSSLSDKYLTQAIAIINDEDTSTQKGAGAIEGTYSADKLLSAQEQQRALSRITALVGDPNIAYDVLLRAFQAGGFSSWQ